LDDTWREEEMNRQEEVEFRTAAIDEIIDLRHDVLIVGTNRTTSEFEGDHDKETLHFGAFIQGSVVGCLSLMRRDLEGKPALQLRGMATRADLRGRGIGRGLLRFAEGKILRDSPIRILWCNARISATGFYQKQGWRFVSEEFLIEGVGPHRKMTKLLQSRR